MPVVERSYKKKSAQQEEQKKIKYEALPRLPRERALDAHREAMDRGAECEKCPLFGLRSGPVMGDVVRNARLTIIGEAPGNNELETKRPFVGESGRKLNECLHTGGLAREECTITNVLLCRPPEEYKAFEYRLRIMHEAACERARLDGQPEPKPPVMPYEACKKRLANDITESDTKFVLAVGKAALESVADHWNVPYGSAKKVKPGELRIGTLKKQIGSPITLPDGTIAVASYHPAFAMRKGSRHYMHVVKEHMTRAAKIAARGSIDWSEPEYILNPSVSVIEQTLRSMRGRPKTIDIETDKGKRTDVKFDPFSCRIRCIGFGANVDGKEVIIVVPLRYINGDEWWPDIEDKKRVLQACIDALNDNSPDPHTQVPAYLIGQNLAFDTSVLLRFKLLCSREMQWEDTMLMHHDTMDNDLPHDLGFIAARYFEVPSWKGVADDKFYENVSDHDLHLYNGRDVLTTMRLYPVLCGEVARCGTFAQYEQDRLMAPIARDMGELGLFIDEVKRGELSLKLNTEAYAKLLELKKITKNPKFSPNSAPQIRRYLFVTKKMVPEVNTKGKDWEEGEDPSTNAASLTRMVSKQGVDEEVKEFINTLLEYRAYMKLKSTYVDKLQVTYEDWSKYGMDIPMLPEVKGPVWIEYKKWKDKEKPNGLSKQEIAEKLYKDEWEKAFAPVPKGLKKGARQEAAKARKILVESILARIDDGEWREDVVIPARPALSRLHTTYKIHIIPSGRMSTSPAVQNWPKYGKANMHEMVISPPGYVMVGADLDQVELRLYAAIAGDKLLLEAFEKGLDPHSYNAASLFAKQFGMSIWDAYLYIVGLPDMHATIYGKAAIKTHALAFKEEDVPEHVKILNQCMKDELKRDGIISHTGWDPEYVDALLEGHKKGDKEKKKLRGYAKTFAYLEAYGGEADKLFSFMSTAREKGTSKLMFPDLKEEDVHEWHEQWHSTHPETKAWQNACERIARNEGFTASPIGTFRKRFFPGGPNKPGATFNHVIQSSASEIANAALIKIAQAIPYGSLGPFSGVILQIHDYIGVLVPKEHGKWAKKIIEDALNTSVFGVAITATAQISDKLSDQ